MKKILLFFILSLFLMTTYDANAETNQEVKTKGTIGFTGQYEPNGTPDPKPPESIMKPPITEMAKPEGTFPQTNDSVSPKFFWFGTLIISFVFIFWKRNNKQIQN